MGGGLVLKFTTGYLLKNKEVLEFSRIFVGELVGPFFFL